MNIGYRILIHKSLKDNDYEKATKFLNSFIDQANKNGYGSDGGYRSYYKRGTFGMWLNYHDLPDYTFKRVVKNRRIFAIVPINDLTNVNLNQCMCSQHLGGSKVKFKKPFDESEYNLYYETGIIKG